MDPGPSLRGAIFLPFVSLGRHKGCPEMPGVKAAFLNEIMCPCEYLSKKCPALTRRLPKARR